jgi:hypothetical protein
MIRWTNWIVFEANSGPCGLSRGINRFCGICSMRWASQNKPGGQPESLDDLVSFFSYASEEPESLKFNLQGEEAEQKSTLDLLLLGIWSVLEIIDGQKAYARKDPIATTAWNNMLSGKPFYRHYWKSELLEWINHLKDCEQGPCTPKNSDYQRIRQEFKINSYGILVFGVL